MRTDAWYIESHTETIRWSWSASIDQSHGSPLLVHSTSWRRGASGVILSFLVVVGEDQASELASVPIGRPSWRGTRQLTLQRDRHRKVVEHALRHVAWLAQDDEAVRAAYRPPGWRCWRTIARAVPPPR